MKGLITLVLCWALFFFSVLHYTPPATIAWVLVTAGLGIWSLYRYSGFHSEPEERSGDEPL